MLGVNGRMAFEGQAAMQLEGLAEAYGPVDAEQGLVVVRAGNELDLGGLVMRLADERDAGRGAALFHATLVAAPLAFHARLLGAATALREPFVSRV
jgi:hydrogenase maturation protein HypF